ncbi:MAG: hypothetical protein ACXVB9_01610 [Bdellovibrionota bacterium]
MKISAIALLSILASGQAFASVPPQTVSVTCDGQELALGKTGRTGQVVVAASTKGVYINAPWTINVSWKGSDVLVAPGSVCGAEITADIACTEYASGALEGVFTIFQACGIGAFDTRGLPHHVSDVRLSLWAGHGRFSCAAHDAGKYAQIELSNCR